MRFELALIVGIVFFCCWCAYIIIKMNSSVSSSPNLAELTGGVYVANHINDTKSSLEHNLLANYLQRYNSSPSVGNQHQQQFLNQINSGYLRQPEANSPAAYFSNPNQTSANNSRQQLLSAPYSQQQQTQSLTQLYPKQPQLQPQQQQQQQQTPMWRDYSSVTPQHGWSVPQSYGHKYDQLQLQPNRWYAPQAATNYPTRALWTAPSQQEQGKRSMGDQLAIDPPDVGQPASGGSSESDEEQVDGASQDNPDPDGEQSRGERNEGQQSEEEEPEDGEQQEEPAVNREIEERAARRSFSEDKSDANERDRNGRLVVTHHRHLLNGKPIPDSGGAQGLRDASQADLDKIANEIEDDSQPTNANSTDYDDIGPSTATTIAAPNTDMDADANLKDKPEVARESRRRSAVLLPANETASVEMIRDKSGRLKQRQLQSADKVRRLPLSSQAEARVGHNGGDAAAAAAAAATTTGVDVDDDYNSKLAGSEEFIGKHSEGQKETRPRGRKIARGTPGKVIKQAQADGSKGTNKGEKIGVSTHGPKIERDSHEHRLSESLTAQQWDDDAASSPGDTKSSRRKANGDRDAQSTAGSVPSTLALAATTVSGRQQQLSGQRPQTDGTGAKKGADEEEDGTETGEGENGAGGENGEEVQAGEGENKVEPEEEEEEGEEPQQQIEFKDLDLFVDSGKFPFMDSSNEADNGGQQRRRKRYAAPDTEMPEIEAKPYQVQAAPILPTAPDQSTIVSGHPFTQASTNSLSDGQRLAVKKQLDDESRGLDSPRQVVGGAFPVIALTAHAQYSPPGGNNPNNGTARGQSVEENREGTNSGLSSDIAALITQSDHQLVQPTASHSTANKMASNTTIASHGDKHSPLEVSSSQSADSETRDTVSGQEDVNIEVLANAPNNDQNPNRVIDLDISLQPQQHPMPTPGPLASHLPLPMPGPGPSHDYATSAASGNYSGPMLLLQQQHGTYTTGPAPSFAGPQSNGHQPPDLIGPPNLAHQTVYSNSPPPLGSLGEEFSLKHNQQQVASLGHHPGLLASFSPTNPLASGSKSAKKTKKLKHSKSKVSDMKYKAALAAKMKKKSKFKKGNVKKRKKKDKRKLGKNHKEFEGSVKGKKGAKGGAKKGAKKGSLYFKDKGYKKRGFKKEYKKSESGDHKTYFDEYRDKDHKKKWKDFEDKHHYKQSKKWSGKDKKKFKNYDFKKLMDKKAGDGSWNERERSKYYKEHKYKAKSESKKKKIKKKKKKKKDGEF